ncbi:MAG TPA: hypothetical protein VGM03_13825 [Phycisphaerae bacterium]|jgi:hypothetical protein
MLSAKKTGSGRIGALRRNRGFAALLALVLVGIGSGCDLSPAELAAGAPPEIKDALLAKAAPMLPVDPCCPQN